MAESEKKRRLIVLAVMVLLLILAVVLYFIFKTGAEPIETPIRENAGEMHHGWTPFYHAVEGEWRMLDAACFVLGERKFVSSERERDEYLVYRVETGGILRIMEARGRWKEVEVLDENGQIKARGWIDADPIRKVERLVPAINEQH